MTHGVDLYWGNGDIDFGPYDFVILQAYDGATGLVADAHGGWFTRNAQRALDEGKVLMTYFWLSPRRSVATQVQTYLDVVAGWPTRFHWVDYEEGGLGTEHSDAALAGLPAGTSGVYSNGGQYPGGVADERPWWAAGYPNVWHANRPYVIHQYADTPHDENAVTDDGWYAGVVGGAPPAPTPAKPAAKPKTYHAATMESMLITVDANDKWTLYCNGGSASVSKDRGVNFLFKQGVPWMAGLSPLESLSLLSTLDPTGFQKLVAAAPH